MRDHASWVPDRCDIILLDCTSMWGDALRCHKPFLVLSHKAFNERTSRVIGLQLAFGDRCALSSVRSGQHGRASGKSLQLFVQVPRFKSLNWRRRGAIPYPVRRLSDSFFANVCLLLKEIV